MDLNKLLNNVINKYGKNKGYEIPTISWSDENMFSTFAEYQYWKNHIKISRLLNNEKISEKVIEALIYHEYTHQLIADHTAEFNKKMEKFDDYSGLIQEAEEYYNSIEEMEHAKTHGIKFDIETDTILVRIPMNEKDEDSYLKEICYMDHYITGRCIKDIPTEFDGFHKQVIFTIDINNQSFIVGFARDVVLHSEMYNCSILELRDKRLKYEDSWYQYKYYIEDGRTLFPIGAISLGDYRGMPNSYKDDGICLLRELGEEDNCNIINAINEYDLDLHYVGMLDTAIDCIASIEINDVEEIVELAYKNPKYMRKIWIMNKAVDVNPCRYTYYERAKILADYSLYDCAMLDIAKALSYPNDEKNDVNSDEALKLFRKCAEVHERFNQDYKMM